MKRPAAGFTLIEVLVALTIAALGLAFFLSATGVGLENASLAEQYVQATRRAQSRLAQVGRALPLKQGDYSGDDGGGFRWAVKIAPPLAHTGGGAEQSRAVVLYPIDVSIVWRNGTATKEVALHSARIGPP